MSKNNIKKFFIPTLGVFGVITAFHFIFNEIIIGGYYLEYNHLFKPQDEIQKNQNLLYLANLFFSIAFIYIYSKGHENKNPIVQGIKFGLWVTALMWIPLAIVNHVYYSYPRVLEIGWFIEHITESILAGVTAATLMTRN